MASRRAEKQAVRQQRLAREQAVAQRQHRARRLWLFGGTVIGAVVAVVAGIAISSSGSPWKRGSTAAHVNSLLSGIPESGDVLGCATAPVTFTEYGDLECSVCGMLATPPSLTNPEGEQGTGWEDHLIQQYVRPGKVRFVFRALETASSGNPNAGAFRSQQVAADAAGLQGKAWYYIELFYNEQGAEDTDYVTESYLQGLARQIQGLDFARWMTDRNLAGVGHQVSADNAAGLAVAAALGTQPGTPMIVIEGPHGKARLPPGLPSSYGELEKAIASVQ